MEDNKLFDESVRDFITGSKDHSTLLKPTFVMAGAGAGKTTSIKLRILNLILHQNVSPKEMVIITYTVKAAQELNTRIREVIEEEIKTTISDEARKKLTQALDELSLARISTVHSFCHDLLLEYPIEFNVDPAAKILDSRESKFLSADCQNEFLKHYILKDGEHFSKYKEAFDAYAVLEEHIFDSKIIFDAFQLLYENRDMKPKEVNFNFEGREAVEASIMHKFHEIISRLKEIDSICKDKTDKLYIAAADYLEYAKNIESIEDFIKYPINRTLFGLKEGNQKSWPVPWFTDFKDTRKEFREEYDRYKLLAHATYYKYLVTAFQGYSKLVDNYKHENGLIDFFDCLLLVRNVLRDNKFLRQTVQKQFKVFIIDEFQDSDPIQSDIAKLLSEDLPSKLMFVGDGKQAIFGFARSDIEVFRAMGKTVKDEFKGELLELSTNFRAEEKQLDFINQYFKDILKEDYGEMHVCPDKKHGKGLVATLSMKVKLPSETDDLHAGPRREREAFLVAKKIKEMIDAGRKPQDFLLLFRKSTPMEKFEKLLIQLGVPVLNTKSRDYLRKEQALEILSIMGYFIFPEDKFFTYALEHASFSDGKVPEELKKIETTELGIKTKLREAVNALGISHAAKILNDPTYLELTEYLLSAFDTEVGLTKGNYSQAFLQLYKRASEERFSFDSDEKVFYEKLKADAVRLMTIHSSKGLEAPVVFLIAHDALDNQAAKVCVDRAKEEVYPVNSFIKKETLAAYTLGDLNGLLQRQEEKRLEEEKRVLYVACTRSQEELYIVHSEDLDMSPFLSPLSDAIVKNPILERMNFSDMETEFNELPKITKSVAKDESTIKFNAGEFREISKLKAGTPAVTTLISAPELFRNSKGFGMEFGSFAHKVMETVVHVLQQGGEFQVDEVIKKIGELMEYELKDDAALALEQGIDKFQKSEIAKLIKDAKAVHTEIRFYLPQDYHGIIDLVIEGKDRSFMVVDFKTDVLGEGEEGEKIKEHYKKQVEFYVKGLEQVRECKIEGVCFYLIS